MIRWPWNVIADAIKASGVERGVWEDDRTEARAGDQAIADAIASLKPPAPEPTRPRITADERMTCLACDAPGPFVSCVVLRDYARRDGIVISDEVGDRVCCQRCAAQFSITHEGKFRHHPLAEPFTGGPTPTQANANAPPEIERPHGEAPAWPMARQKPGV